MYETAYRKTYPTRLHLWLDEVVWPRDPEADAVPSDEWVLSIIDNNGDRFEGEEDVLLGDDYQRALNMAKASADLQQLDLYQLDRQGQARLVHRFHNPNEEQ